MDKNKNVFRKHGYFKIQIKFCFFFQESKNNQGKMMICRDVGDFLIWKKVYSENQGCFKQKEFFGAGYSVLKARSIFFNRI
jgi:hypothetical protein